MNIKMILAETIAATLIVGAVAESAKPRLDTPEKRAAYARQKRADAIARQGGLLHAPAKGTCVKILNSQNRVSAELVAAVAEDISAATTVDIDVVDKVSSDGCARAMLKLVDSAEAPSILVAPEEMRGELNVARLMSNAPERKLFEKRFRQELWRAFAMTLGAGNSIYQPCLMKTITSVEELDAIPLVQPCPEVLDKIQRTADEQKLGRRRLVTYRTACREGWAPAPTNDIQRAIAEQVKADKERGPTNPILIPPPNGRK